MESKTKRFELVISGVGGQGILFIGRLLAEVATSRYKNVTYFPNYGAAMRGGDSECTVVFSEEEIASPLVFRPQTAIVMEEAALKQLEPRLRPKGKLFLDSSLVPGRVRRKNLKVFYIPATEAALKLGSVQVANLVMLGACVAGTGVFPLNFLYEALARRMAGTRRESLLELNRKALEEGARLGAERPKPGKALAVVRRAKKEG